MKKFLITVSTDWCGMDNTYRAEAESDLDLSDIANSLAYDNWESYNCIEYIAEELGYDIDEMTDTDWGDIQEQATENPSWYFEIEEFEGTEEEWNSYEPAN